MAAQLQARKPALVPGESGEGFYRTMSFQVRGRQPEVAFTSNHTHLQRLARNAATGWCPLPRSFPGTPRIRFYPTFIHSHAFRDGQQFTCNAANWLVQILSWYPRIVVYPNFIDRARAARVIKHAQAAMYPSGLAYRPGEKGDAQQQVRTSRGEERRQRWQWQGRATARGGGGPGAARWVAPLPSWLPSRCSWQFAAAGSGSLHPLR